MSLKNYLWIKKIMEDNKTLDDFAKWCDDKADFKSLIGGIAGSVVETIDGYLIGAAIKLAYSKCPDQHKQEVLMAMTACMTSDYSELSESMVDNAVDVLKTGLGDEREKIIIGGLVDIGFKLAKSYIKQ